MKKHLRYITFFTVLGCLCSAHAAKPVFSISGSDKTWLDGHTVCAYLPETDDATTKSILILKVVKGETATYQIPEEAKSRLTKPLYISYENKKYHKFHFGDLPSHDTSKIVYVVTLTGGSYYFAKIEYSGNSGNEKWRYAKGLERSEKIDNVFSELELQNMPKEQKDKIIAIFK